MPAGTITLTNNSAIVKGAGTAFTTELKPGDFIVAVVGGVTYTLPVKTVDNATQATLIRAYDGPTQAGAAWSAVPRETLNAITAQLAAESSRALRGLNYDKNNWQQVFSATGNVTVKLPDGSTFTGPAWGGMAAKGANSDITSLAGLTTALSVKQGGTGAGDAAKARDNLGLGSVATLDRGSNDGQVMPVGTAMSGNNIDLNLSWPLRNIETEGVYGSSGGYNWPWPLGAGETGSTPVAWAAYTFGSQLRQAQIAIQAFNSAKNLMFFRAKHDNNFSGWVKVITSNITTVDANGFYKSASPIARLCNSTSDMPSGFNDGFLLSGIAAVNGEAEGVSAERVSTGVYRVSGALGLAKDGWTIEIPQDVNGNRLCFVSTETTEDGAITVHVSLRQFDTKSPNIVAGEPMDIPAGRWIDLRLEMPKEQ